ncbi:hypothetical protein HNR42_002315 [Deinobacterium chartae]|uniref:Uncharacterized protein n=1 Tax=Deinobacterium chartae TaxID=521158 RepID=A0A841I386_9DEIO|nr:hypothetical protein [Deinobacterium chartae]MBB6098880.1 hypothetical protein [Deinobacterium chartae]
MKYSAVLFALPLLLAACAPAMTGSAPGYNPGVNPLPDGEVLVVEGESIQRAFKSRLFPEVTPPGNAYSFSGPKSFEFFRKALQDFKFFRCEQPETLVWFQTTSRRIAREMTERLLRAGYEVEDVMGDAAEPRVVTVRRKKNDQTSTYSGVWVYGSDWVTLFACDLRAL